MPAAAKATPEHIRDANKRYHDAAAAEYDAKWGIDFRDLGRDQTRQKLVKALGEWPAEPFAHALEIGAGTGYFSLNLMQQDAFERLTATDISTGMLDALTGTAADLGLAPRVETVRTDAEGLPFDDESFDLVFGHAILHHIPDLGRAFSEFRRVLRPGGAVVFCGEPSRNGDRLAVVPKRLGALTASAWRRLVGASALNGNGSAPGVGSGHDLESEVDIHVFAPGDLRRALAAGGYERIRVRGEELLASVYGWWLRSLESSAVPEEVPDGWRLFAFRSYIALQRADLTLFEPRLPACLFYNLILSARKPG